MENWYERTNKHSAPASPISAAVFSPSSLRLPEKTTFAPAVPRAIAVTRPIPDVPPVTKGHFIFKYHHIFLLVFS